MSRREGGKYLIINEAGTFVSRSPEVVEEDIPMPATGASTSPPRPVTQDVAGPSNPPPMPEECSTAPTPITLEIIMAKLDSLTTE
ncbi:hypothetical protein ACLOJK_029455, partial [Asimina triloba]